MIKNKTILKSAAIVCREIAVDKFPILYAERSEPEDKADSGWQFLCNSTKEDVALAQVWAIGEVLDFDKSLEPFIELPAGTILKRASANIKWEVIIS